MKKYLVLLVMLVGCREPLSVSHQPNIPLPPDEVMEEMVYKDIKDIRRFSDRIEAIFVEKNELQYLRCRNYKVIIDAETPWWEEKRTKVYAWRYYERWVRVSYTHYSCVVHISKLEDIQSCGR